VVHRALVGPQHAHVCPAEQQVVGERRSDQRDDPVLRKTAADVVVPALVVEPEVEPEVGHDDRDQRDGHDGQDRERGPASRVLLDRVHPPQAAETSPGLPAARAGYWRGNAHDLR
jgi:hypothetical protein